MITLRPYEPDDLPLRVKYFNIAWPGYAETAEGILTEDAAWPESEPIERFAVLREREVVGFTAWYVPFWSKAEGRYYISVMMEEDDPDVGEAYDQMIAMVMKLNPTEMVSHGRTDLPTRMKVLESRGFKERERSPASRLLPANYHESKFRPLVERLTAEGIRLVDFATLEAEGYDWRRPLYDAVGEMVADIPTNDPMTMESFEDFLKEIEPWGYHPPLMFAAMDQGQLVGYMRLERMRGDPAHCFTSFGGVVRSHRRRGIITALKAISIPVARDQFGVTLISTDNVESNPMWNINQSLGFELWFEIVRYKLSIGEGETG
jgi:hypothetical protein